MHAKLNYSRPSSISTAVAAALATFIAIGLVVAVTHLFRHDGALMEQWAAAERACQQSTYISEREACMREWLAAARGSSVASK